MKKLIARIQKDISKLQSAVHKEGNDLLEKIKDMDLKTNLEHTKKDLMKLLSAKLKKIEPTYNTFVDTVRKNAKKAGKELEKIEKSIKAKAKGAKKNFASGKKGKSKSSSKSNSKKKSRRTAAESGK